MCCCTSNGIVRIIFFFHFVHLSSFRMLCDNSAAFSVLNTNNQLHVNVCMKTRLLSTTLTVRFGRSNLYCNKKTEVIRPFFLFLCWKFYFVQIHRIYSVSIISQIKRLWINWEMSYQLYRNTTLGNTLQESLDELIQVCRAVLMKTISPKIQFHFRNKSDLLIFTFFSLALFRIPAFH